MTFSIFWTDHNSQARRDTKKIIFRRAEDYVKEYRAKEAEEIRLKRVARTSGDFYVPAQPKVYFVVRIKGWAFFSGVSKTRSEFVYSSISKIAPQAQKNPPTPPPHSNQ